MISWIARITTERRALVLGVLAVAAVVLGIQIPNIRLDPSVENLISSYEGGDNVREIFEADFGDSSRAMVLLFQADDVLAAEPLQYVHAISGELEQYDWVERVVSLTRAPMPRRVDADPEGNLDDLDELEDLDDVDFDNLEGEEALDGVDEDAAVIDAIISIVEADPERFPGGFQSLGPELSGELVATPIVEGEEVLPEDIEELRAALAQNELFDGRLISHDRSVVVTAMLLAEGDGKEMARRVVHVRELLADHPPPEGVEVRMGGLPHVRTTMMESMRADQIILVPLTLLVCMILLGVFLRWLPGVLLPIVAVAITAEMVVGGMALVGEPFSVLNNIIPTLLIIIGISDSIHLIGRYREELALGDGRIRAGARTVRHMAVACFLTSLTTAVGLASLVVSKTAMLRHFGVTAGLGVLVAYGVTITFLPAVLTWIRPPKGTRDGEPPNDQAEDVEAPTAQQGGFLESGIEGLTRGILRHPWIVLALTGAMMGGAGYCATELVVDHAMLDQFDERDPVYVTTRLLEEKLDGVRPFEVSFRSDTEGRFYDAALLTQIDELAAWARSQPEVLSTMSSTRLLRETLVLLSQDDNARTAPFVSDEQVRALSSLLSARGEEHDPLMAWVTPDRRHFRLQFKVRDVGAQRTMALAAELEQRIEEVMPDDVRVGFTGEAYDGSTGMDAVVFDLLSSLLLAIAIIFVLLTALFRSLRLGLLSIPPNLIPLVFTMAYMVWRDIPLNAATGIIYSISLGLAVDGTIHVLARFREEAMQRGLDAERALLIAARSTGRAIVVSCLTLMAGFSVLLFSSFVPVQRFGELIAVTVACTLFATLVVQPALLYVAGGRRAPSKAAE